MQWIDRTRMASQVLAGTFLNLGSSAAVEIAAGTGFDWVLLDCEHGSGSWGDLRAQLLAVRGTPAAPIVRIRSLNADDVKFVLDSGAADRVVRSALNLLGEKKAPLAFLSSGFLLGIPVFFDTVFYLMMPLGKALRVRTGEDAESVDDRLK